MSHHEFMLGGKPIGLSSKVFVIAEVGINHDGSVEQALKLIDAASDCGAEAVKFQTFRADRLMVATPDRLAQQTDGSETAYEMFRRLELSWDDHKKLKDHADRRGILFLSTPFDEESADFLDALGVPGFKIASSDLTHIPLLRHIARKGRPILLSTGMSFLAEVEEAVHTLRDCGAHDIVLLHCVSSYPAPPESLNLRSMLTLRDHFHLPVGFSDHSQGTLFSLIAAALGARVLERHFTLDRNAPGPDHKASLDPGDLRALITGLGSVEASLGNGDKHPSRAEEQGRQLSRRSIVTAADIRAHETIHPWMLTCKRPAGGLHPCEMDKVIGMRTRRDLVRDSVLHWEDLLPSSGAGAAGETIPETTNEGPQPSGSLA
jgi:N,N'-diacetyllegionaminate synthase